MKTERVLATRSHSVALSLSGNMAGAEEAASFGSHLNGDLDPDDREEGASSTAEEAAKKKRRKKKKSKGAVSGKGVMFFFFFFSRGPCQEWPNDLAWARHGWPSAGNPEPWPSLIPRPRRSSMAGFLCRGFSGMGCVLVWRG